MARFYQTTQRNFKDNFIFQPNWELAATSLLSKDNEIQNNLDTLNLLNNLPIENWEKADGENVRQIRDQYESRVNDITEQLQKDILNTTKARSLINELKQDITRDYQSGNIKKIQDNAAAYKKFMASLEAMPNPEDREAYKKAIDEYLINNPQGAYSSQFTAPELYNMQDIWQGFTNSAGFKAVQPDLVGSKITNTNGRYFITKGNETKELSQTKVGQAFMSYLQGANLQGYANSKQKYNGQNWLDENGNYRFDSGSYLGNIIATGIPSLAYKTNSTEQGLAVDQYGTMAQENAYKVAAESRARFAEANNITSPDASSDATFLYNHAIQKIEERDQAVRDIAKRYGINPNTMNIETLIKWGDNMLKTPGKYNKNISNFVTSLKGLQASVNASMRATWAPFRAAYTNKDIDIMQKDLTNYFAQRGAATPMKWDLTNVLPNTGNKEYSLHGTPSPNQVIGMKIGDYTVTGAKVIPGTTLPIKGSTDNIRDSYLQNMVEISMTKGKQTIIKKVPTYASGEVYGLSSTVNTEWSTDYNGNTIWSAATSPQNNKIFK